MILHYCSANTAKSHFKQKGFFGTKKKEIPCLPFQHNPWFINNMLNDIWHVKKTNTIFDFVSRTCAVSGICVR